MLRRTNHGQQPFPPDLATKDPLASNMYHVRTLFKSTSSS